MSFSEFFSSESDATISPFLTPKSRRWAKHLPLRISLMAAVILSAAFVCSFFASLQALSLFLQMLVYFLVGTPALIEAIKEVKELKINIDVLMVFAAFVSIFIHSSLEGGLLLVLFSISSSLELFVTTKAKSSLNTLNEMAPTSARLVTASGRIKERSVNDIQVDEIILVRAGEVVPLDGMIIEGSSSLNISHLTGEHLPVNVQLGHEVAAGSVNIEGSLKLKVTKTGADSTISRIINLICEAQEARPKLQTWFDRFGQRYSIFVMASSFLFALLLPVFFQNMGYFTVEGSIYRALAYLIAASPCALIIAVPIAYISAINASAREGIILKGGITLDTLAQIKAIAFDKTGTLTSGELECLDIKDIHGQEVKESLRFVLSVAKALEQHAIHPIAKAVIGYADAHHIEATPIANCRAYPGQGIEGEIEKEGAKTFVAIGSLSFIRQKVPASLIEKIDRLPANDGHLLTALLIDQEVFVMQFVDHLKPEAKSVLENLKQEFNLSIYVLSGDNPQSVERIAQNLQVDKYFGGLKPEDKLKLIEYYSHHMGLAMVGDGINDAPALARASIGISMGRFGSHMATEVAEVVLIKDDLSLIHKLLNRAKKTLGIVKQNVVLASLIIVGVSIPALFGLIPLWLAVVCHEGGTVLVGLNSLRLLKK